MRFWDEQVIALNRERRAININDRTAMVEHMDRWKRTRRQFDQAQCAASYSTTV